MIRCKQCALEFGTPLKAPTADWYGIAYRVLSLYPSDRWEFGEVIRHVRPRQRLFEIGCGSGMFLDRCRASGIEAQGIDCIEEAIRACAAKGLNASLERLGEASLPPAEGQFDHISAFHLLEHLDNPRSLFERASRLAGGNCHLWLSVPSDQRASRRFGKTDFLDQPPHHMSRWNPEAFAAIGARTGWKLAEVIYEPKSRARVLAAWAVHAAFQAGLQAGQGPGKACLPKACLPVDGTGIRSRVPALLPGQKNDGGKAADGIFHAGPLRPWRHGWLVGKRQTGSESIGSGGVEFIPF
jgi:ubiquinone/menaquinone biosynthesis C-methylase UbiE